jgi:hypothetical protein
MNASAGMLQRRLSPVLVLALGFGLAASANAQQPSQAQINAIKASCRSDYMAHCASVPTGGPAALACLQKNIASLSPPCQEAVSAAGGEASPPAGSQSQPPDAAQSPLPGADGGPPPQPGADGAPPQPGAEGGPPPQPGTGGAPPPPPGAGGAPSPSAGDFPPMGPRAAAAAVRGACRFDYRALCGDVPPGGGRIIACLRRNEPSLSPRCRRALMMRFR